MLVLENISKYYKISGTKRKILDSVSMELKNGEMAALTGRSGSGKSTLLNIISGLTVPSDGKVFINQKRMHYFMDIIPAHMRNRQIGFVFQTFRLLSEETVWWNILLPARLRGWIDKKVRERGERILKDLQMEDWKHMKAGLLSGGQKQRVAIARALINDPALILSDEPTANLDKETSLEIGKIFKELAESGKTVLVVTHQDYFFKHADIVFHLNEGILGAGK